eukprot:3848644-Rhodomonas_salina.5
MLLLGEECVGWRQDRTLYSDDVCQYRTLHSDDIGQQGGGTARGVHFPPHASAHPLAPSAHPLAPSAHPQGESSPLMRKKNF